MTIKRITLILVTVGALVALTGCPPPSSAKESWQYQLGETVDPLTVGDHPAKVFDIDGFDHSASDVAAVNAAGKYAICYISTSYENWRPDQASFPASVKGNPLDGWPGERWVDIRQISILQPIFEARAQMCKDKGFSAIEWDNVDAYSNSTGFPLTAAHQVTFNEMLAQITKALGLSPGLKNAPDLVPQLVDDFQFAIVEQCVQYNECDAFSPFQAAGKPVFVVEYERTLAQTCAVTNPLGFSGIVKTYDLYASPWQACR